MKTQRSGARQEPNRFLGMIASIMVVSKLVSPLGYHGVPQPSAWSRFLPQFYFCSFHIIKCKCMTEKDCLSERIPAISQLYWSAFPPQGVAMVIRPHFHFHKRYGELMSFPMVPVNTLKAKERKRDQYAWNHLHSTSFQLWDANISHSFKPKCPNNLSGNSL